MYDRLIALEKQPSSCPFSVRETRRRLFVKCVLKFTRTEATNTFEYDQICDGLKVGIDGTLNGIQAIWDTNLSTENWNFLIVDAKDAFNGLNCVGMMWMVRHLWPSGDRLIFNFIINGYPSSCRMGMLQPIYFTAGRSDTGVPTCYDSICY